MMNLFCMISCLCFYDFEVVFESNKVVITVQGVFIGKGYIRNDLFKLSLICLSLLIKYIIVLV